MPEDLLAPLDLDDDAVQRGDVGRRLQQRLPELVLGRADADVAAGGALGGPCRAGVVEPARAGRRTHPLADRGGEVVVDGAGDEEHEVVAHARALHGRVLGRPATQPQAKTKSSPLIRPAPPRASGGCAPGRRRATRRTPRGAAVPRPRRRRRGAWRRTASSSIGERDGLVVLDVHRDLHDAPGLELQPERPHSGQPVGTALAHGARGRERHVQRRVDLEVERDERRPGGDERRAPARVHPRRPEVRGQLAGGQPLGERGRSAAADLRAGAATGQRAVEQDGHAQAPDLLRRDERLGARRAAVGGGAVHERARRRRRRRAGGCRARPRGRCAAAPPRSPRRAPPPVRPGSPGEGEDGTVVVDVGVDVEHPRARAGERVPDGRERVAVAPLRDVGHRDAASLMRRGGPARRRRAPRPRTGGGRARAWRARGARRGGPRRAAPRPSPSTRTPRPGSAALPRRTG